MIFLLCDHAGFDLKESIKNRLFKKGYDIVDVGAFTKDDNDDFSTYINLVKKSFDCSKKEDKIIAVCGSGVGMNIGLNKIKGVRCVVGHNVKEVQTAREHNNINALALGGRCVGEISAYKMIDTFLSTVALGGKYKKRMDDIEIK